MMALDCCFRRGVHTNSLLTVFVAYVEPRQIYDALSIRSQSSDRPAIELLAKRRQDMNLTTCADRSDKEAAIRAKYRDGTLGLDMNNMRQRLLDMGLQYVTYDEDKKIRD